MTLSESTDECIRIYKLGTSWEYKSLEERLKTLEEVLEVIREEHDTMKNDEGDEFNPDCNYSLSGLLLEEIKKIKAVLG
jgi:hypothetical protein